jgi:hypothetical protein
MLNQPTQPDTLTTEETAAIVETYEAFMFRILLTGLSPELLAEYGGASWHEVGGATAGFFEKLPHPFFNRVIGLGLHQPATEVMIDELMGLYGRGHIPFMISVSPAAQPAQLTDWLLERGFRHSSNWAKVIRGTNPPPKIETELHIEQVDETTAGQYAAVVQTGFQMPAWTATLYEHMAKLSNVYSYIAYAGDVPAGVGTLLVSGEWGALFNAATLPKYRRRGAQGAIMARRIRDGISLGCRWFTTETGEDTPNAPNPSYHNMIRTGFQLAYLRPNYLYDFK